MPTEFFTIESTLSLGGAVTMVFVVCNGCQKALDFNPKWLALVISLIIALIAVAHHPGSKILDYIVGIINGFLIFCTSAGATEAVGKKSLPAPGPKTFGGPAGQKNKRNFLSS